MRAALLLSCFLALSACGKRESDPAAPPEVRAEAGYCSDRTFEGAHFTVCPFDSRTQELRLVDEGRNGLPLRSFEALESALGHDAPRLIFAMNAGMYDEQGRPIGLFVQDGKERHKLNRRKGGGNFHLQPNGVFGLEKDGSLFVAKSDSYAEGQRHPASATQSGPMLVIDGRLHPKIDNDGPSRYLRNGVGVADAHTAYFVISDDAVSFGKLARFFRDALHCPNALFLDGSVSSLWDPAAERQDAYTELGPMVLVLKREPSPAK